MELWCQDEARIGQKGGRSRTWAEKGSRPRGPGDTRYGYAYLFGAFCSARDTGVGLVMPTANTQAMNLHLEEISRTVPDHVHVALLMDGAGWHTTKKLTLPHNITPVQLPPYSPHLNPAEKPWQYLKDNAFAHRVFESHAQLLDEICAAWNALLNEKGRIRSLTDFSY